MESKHSQTTSNFLKDFPTPIAALAAFLESEKKAAVMRRRQCDKFLLAEIEDEFRRSMYSLRTKAEEEFRISVRLLSLIR